MPKLYKLIISYIIWDKVFKNGPSKICGREPLKNLKGYFRYLEYGLQIRLSQTLILFIHT